MKLLNRIENTRVNLKHLALAAALGVGLGAGNAQAAILNGDFETGDFTGWTIESSIPAPVIDTAIVHSGTYSAFLGSDPGVGDEPDGQARISQTINNLPAGATLSFWYLRKTADSGYDGETAYIADTDGNVLHRFFDGDVTDPDWQHLTYDLFDYAGQNIKIVFQVKQDAYGDNSSMRVDDVTITTAAPAEILTFGPGAVIDQGTRRITWVLPYGSPGLTLSPTYTLSSGSCLPVSNPDPAIDFSDSVAHPVSYLVTDSGTSNEYFVTITVDGIDGLNEKTYIGRDAGSDLDPISNLMAATPTATGPQTAKIDYHGSSFATLPGAPGPEHFSILWEGWFDVTKDGSGVYTFGTSSDDGSVIYMDLNGDGDFADSGEYIVNNNGYQGDTQRTAEVNLTMNAVHIVIGFYQGTGGYDMRAAFKKGTGLGFGNLDLINSTSGYFYKGNPYAGPPAGPTGLAASPLHKGVRLDWTASSGVTGYNVYRGTVTGVYAPTAIATTTAPTYQDKDATLVNGTTYYYVVKATNSLGEGDPSNQASAAPSADPVGQTITFGALASKTYGDPDFNLTATASSELTVGYASSVPAVASVTGNTVTIHKAGTTTITASQGGDADFNAATPVTQDLTVSMANQTITFTLGTSLVKPLNAGLFADTATGGASGNPVIYSSTDVGVATVDSSGQVTIVALGTTQIRADQAGVADKYNAAPQVAQSLTVIPPLALPVGEGVVCWFDASKGVTANSETGVVSAWADQSGLGHHGTTASGTTTLAAGQLNGKPAVQFRTSHLSLAGSMYTAEQYLVLKSPGVFWNGGGAFLAPNGGQNDRIYAMFGGTWGGAPGCFGGFWTDPAPLAVSRNGIAVAPQTGNNFAYPLNPINEYMLVKIDVNTNQYPGSKVPAPYLMGKASNLGYVDFDVCEIVAYDRLLSSADEAKLGGYLANKYGMVTAYPDETPQAQIRSFGLPGAPPATINEAAKTITFNAPTAAGKVLAPDFTMSSGATCDHDSGIAYDFSGPVHYIVTNGSVPGDYTVTLNSVAPSGMINLTIDSTIWPGLVGPAGGLDTTWNTTTAGSGSNLRDSTGFTTGVGYNTTNLGGPDGWGYPNLHVLKKGLRNFDTSSGNSQQLVINGLAGGATYNVYIASANLSGQRHNGVWSTPNATDVPGDHPCGNTTSANGDTWEAGNNYVVFSNTVAAGNGTITFNGHSIAVSGFDCRLPLSGFQVVKVASALTGYALWASVNAPTGAATADFDGDGVSNALEYVLGGTKDVNDLGKLPKISADGTKFSFTLPASSASTGTALRVEFSTDLSDWTTHAATAIAPDASGSIEVTIPNLGAHTFARLEVVIP